MSSAENRPSRSRGRTISLGGSFKNRNAQILETSETGAGSQFDGLDRKEALRLLADMIDCWTTFDDSPSIVVMINGVDV